MARYPVIAHIAGPWHVNFADGSSKPYGPAPHVLYAFGRRVGDHEVMRQARALRGDVAAAAELISGANGSIGRPLSAMFDTEWANEAPCPFPLTPQAWLSDTGVLTARSRAGRADGLFLAAKAGHNAESHNHNDVGSFIVALDGRPLIIDVGVGVYTRQTFGPDRYEIWTMQSSWHNVPEVDGFAQVPGREHAAGQVRGQLGADAAGLSMDIASAYPPQARIRSWYRTIRLDRGGTGDGTILIEDSWDLDYSPERLAVHLITAVQPRLVTPGQLAITGDTRDLVIAYPQGGFDARIQERPVDDSQLASTWGPSVYRITLESRHPASRGTSRLEIAALGPADASE
jgi:hypothetical protein